MEMLLAMPLMLFGAQLTTASAQSPIGTINLTCSGRSERIEFAADEHVISQDGDVRLFLTDEGGSAELPKFIGGPKEGRLTVHLFSVSATMITGKIDYRSIGNAKIRLDRIAGTVAITGPHGNFSGRCQMFDPSTVVTKF